MQKLQQLEVKLNDIIVGKPQQVKLALTCLLAKGHLLLEDLPGAGKTTLAKSFAVLLGLDNKRVQFTADMLPSDISGALIYQPQKQTFSLQKGPIFTNILLADEINRASPKCQSALLEAMDEQQVSIEGQTLPLESPFFVIATQNPSEQYGTFPLPESQLDRFLFRLSMGYLDSASELELLLGQDRKSMLEDISSILTKEELLSYQLQVTDTHLSKNIALYIQNLLQETRDCGLFINGLSTRAGLAIIRAAKAYAFISNVKSVYPEHIQAVFPSVVSHRLQIKSAGSNDKDSEAVIREMMFKVDLPL